LEVYSLEANWWNNHTWAEKHLSNSAAEGTIVQIADLFLKEFDILVKLC
jgi:hypothetical protein